MNERILIVEDEPGLRLVLTDRLTSEGYTVSTAADGPAGLEAASQQQFDLIILDIMLPGMDGLEVCRQLRRRSILTPILMLTARGQLGDKVVGLKVGGDDYLTKPFEMAELLARIEALLRRAAQRGPEEAAVHRFGNITADLRRTVVTREGRPVQLSAKEFQLLQYFLTHRGETLSREELLRQVWGYEAVPNTRTVDVHVAWLRQKLEENPKSPRWILTVVGLGYKFSG